MTIHWLFKGLLFGLAVAAPVGPMAILCLQRSLNRGWKAGWLTGLGIACGDGIFASFAAMGWFLIIARIPSVQFVFRIAGGCGLALLGISILKKASEDSGAAKAGTFRGDWMSAFLLTLANPATIFTFAAFLSILAIPEGIEISAPLALVAGVFTGSALWWLFLSGVAVALRKKISKPILGWINLSSGAIILGFGIWVIYRDFAG